MNHVPPRSRRSAATRVVWLLALGLVTSAANANDPFLRRTITVRVVEEAGPAVVNITTERVVDRGTPFRGFIGDPFMDRFYQDFFDRRARSQTVQNLGSGVLIDSHRHVLTNEHVIAGASRIRVSLSDGREYEATLVGADPNNDLAVLRVETEDELPWIPPGTAKGLMVGEPVIAIGNPFGLSNTVTTGVLSAIDRSINAQDRAYHGFLQTDASINPGNSGGPLLNAEGALIGINTRIYSGADGIGFAIPIDVANRVIAELLEHGEIQPVWLGLEFQNLNPALQEVMDLPEGVFGALVNRVGEDSPASQADVRRGDVVLKMDGHDLLTALGFFQTLETVLAGQEIALEVWRNGKTIEIKITAEEIPRRIIDEMAIQLLGATLLESPRGGFVVTDLRNGGPAQRAKVKRGDIFLGVNGRELKDEDDLREALLNLRGNTGAMVMVQRGGGRYHVAIPFF
jgi:serine protease Do